MKNVLCVVSANPGHIDLGGNGFINVANKLAKNGHKLTWITRAGQVERLIRLQQEAYDEETIPHLWMYGNILKAKHETAILNSICHSLINFQKKLISLNPDIILFDRVLTLGALAADQLKIPYVSMGAPGGYWSNEEGFLQPCKNPVKLYSDIEQLICEKIKWNHNTTGSFWIDSPCLNVCFTGKSFYNVSNKTAYVYNFTDNDNDNDRKRIGISFGNTGSIELMMHVLSSLDSKPCDFTDNIDIYTGNRPDLKERLANHINPGTQVYGWKDFSAQLHNYRFFIFMGGIGTIWHCINQKVPMCVIPSRMTDQPFNAHMVKQLGIGESLLLDYPDTTLVCNTINNFNIDTPYQSAIEFFLSEDNFTDNIQTVCEKITDITH